MESTLPLLSDYASAASIHEALCALVSERAQTGNGAREKRKKEKETDGKGKKEKKTSEQEKGTWEPSIRAGETWLSDDLGNVAVMIYA